MSTALVKIGLSPKRADGERLRRDIQQIIDQRDAGVARLDAVMHDRIRQRVTRDEPVEVEAPPATTELPLAN